MTPPEIAAMLESLYRVRGGAVDFQHALAAAAAVPRHQRLPARLRASRQRRAVAQGPGGRRGDQRPALPDPARCRAVALLRRDAARFRSDRRARPSWLRRAQPRRGEDRRCRRGWRLPGDGGAGTSMSGRCGGASSGGGSVGWPGCAAARRAAAGGLAFRGRAVVLASMLSPCARNASPRRRLPRGCPAGPSLL